MADSVDYAKFKFSITDKGKSIVEEGMTLAYILIEEKVNSIPFITVVFSTPRQPELIKFEDLEITIENPSVFQVKYPMGVYQVLVQGSTVTLTGYACKRRDFMEIGSAYLGKNLEDAVNSLEIRDSIKDCDKIEGGYWRINETRLESLQRLMKGAKSNSIWTVDNTQIKVIDMSQPQQGKDYLAPLEVQDMAHNKRFEGNDYYHVYDDGDDANDMFNVTWNSQSYVGYEHLDFAKNMIASMKYQYPMDSLFKFKYSNMYVTYSPGDFMKMELEAFETGSMCIMSKITRFGLDKIDCWLYFGQGAQ